MEWIDIGQVAKQCNCFSGYDESLECHILNEDKVCNDCARSFVSLTCPVTFIRKKQLFQLLDELESRMVEGGKIVDYHGCDFFPERWFDVVFVLRTNNTLLYDRLEKRFSDMNELKFLQKHCYDYVQYLLLLQFRSNFSFCGQFVLPF